MSSSQSAGIIWDKCLDVIKLRVKESDFEKYFKPITPHKIEQNKLTIKVPSQYYYEYIEEHYITELKSAIYNTIGKEGKLEYIISIDSKNKKNVYYPSTKNINISTQQKTINQEVINPFVIPGIKKIQVDSHLNPSFSFDNFIQGDCNKLARTTGLAAAEAPGTTSFNPYVVYGEVALGKTHLINAIGNRIKTKSPDKNVVYVQAEEFTQQFITSIQNNRGADFKNFYQMLDVLIIDDIQFFMSSKKKTQETFFHIFNYLLYSNKQVIISSDTHPAEIPGIQERILSRFQYGLITDVTYPDTQTRLKILESKAAQQGMSIEQKFLEEIAREVTNNIRQLEGVLVSLLANSMVSKCPISLDMVREVIKKVHVRQERKVSIEGIKKEVCEFFDMDISELNKNSRRREIVQARQLSMAFSKKYTKQSFQKIGEYIGGKNHATVLHSCKVVSDLYLTNPEFKKTYDTIEKKIKALKNI